jgi:phosphoribosyl 1,2-cyclic phosphodiesterase
VSSACENCRRAAPAGGNDIRTRPSMLIDRALLIDPGPDLYHHALTYGFAPADLRGIVATHLSHTGGLLHHELEAALGPHGISVACDGLQVEV